ncbi:MAG: hypothetical protein ACE5J2_05840 [Nitrososphaerales archaeon]
MSELAIRQQMKENTESQGKHWENLKKEVLRDLRVHVPWQKIAKKYHISTKTIQAIKEGDEGRVRSKGEVAAQAFELFENGEDPVAVTIILKELPELVQDLYDKWVEMRDALLIPKSTKEELFEAINQSIGYRVYDLDSLTNTIKNLLEDIVIKFPCYVCRVNMVWNLDKSEDREQIVRILKKGGIGAWHHVRCKRRVYHRETSSRPLHDSRASRSPLEDALERDEESKERASQLKEEMLRRYYDNWR